MVRGGLLGLAVALTLAAVCFWTFLPARAAEASPANLPAGMTQEQFDGLVSAIGDAVVKRLQTEGGLAKPSGEAKEAGKAEPARPMVAGDAVKDEPDAASRFASEFADRSEAVLLAFPSLPGALLTIPPALDRGAEGGHGIVSFLGLLVVASLAVLAVEPVLRLVLKRPRERLAALSRPAEGRHGLFALLALALVDAVAVGGVALLAYGLAGSWFGGTDPQSRFAVLVLTGLYGWRLYLFAFRVVLRPVLSQARLVPLDDGDALAVFARISIVVLGIVAIRVVLRMLIALHTTPEVVAAGQVIGNTAILALFLWASFRSAKPVALWFESLGGLPGRASVGASLARHWLWIAVPFFGLLVLTQLYGAIALRFAVPAAMLYTLNTVIALLLAETVLSVISSRLGGAAERPAGAPAPIRLADVIVRCVRVLIVIVAAVSVAQTWIVDVVALVDAGGWRALTRSSLRAGAALFIAYVAYEFVRLVTHRYAGQGGGAGGVHDEDAGATAGSRLATLMPLLRVFLTIVIAVIALLIVLSELGVNITPLIAGASVLGLAVSFGSQTLVRDIVSGVFYLADDAFRVGEYIDCGKAKGTVEGFTLRSIRLRHQNGQVHTIPFGQLGQITNFSRDWTTVKFNLKLTRDTDLEKLRKLTKKIGQEMMENEEIKDEILEPLKMQGVADIMENALLIRFKFTVKPGKPSYIQREAVKRMVRAFQENGIEFANSVVAVQTVAGAEHPAGAAAAAAQATADRMTAAQAAGAAS